MAVTTTVLQPAPNFLIKMSGFAASGDTSGWVRVPRSQDRSIQSIGTYAGGLSLALQGSNEGDVTTPTSPESLRDSNETVIALTDTDLFQILENTEWIRVIATAGTGGANVTVYIKCT